MIIHRQPVATAPKTPADDWDKAFGVVVMGAGAFLMIQDLFIAGDLAALFSWFSSELPAKREEIRTVWVTIGLIGVRAVALGLLNILSGWGIYSKSKWAFLFALTINVAALVVLTTVLRDYTTEPLFVASGVTVYSLLRLCGLFESKPTGGRPFGSA